MIIGITGGSGTGKSRIAHAYTQNVIELRTMYHALLESDTALQGEVKAAFGTYDRKKTAEIVFNDPLQLDILNTITAKYIHAAVEERLRGVQGDTVIDAAPLFELGLDTKCHVTVAVLARHDLRTARITARDNLTPSQAQTRLNAQKSDDFYAKSADFVIHNNREPADAVERLRAVLSRRVSAGWHKTAIYGGTFDPPTLGHLDVIKRAAALYDTLYVVALVNEAKAPIFTPAERLELLEAITRDIPNVKVDTFTGLLSEYAYKKNIRYSVRGVRNGFDADYERPMFEFNAQIAREEFGFELDTIFIPTTRDHSDTSSGNVCRLLVGGAYNVAAKYLDKRIIERVVTRFSPPRAEKPQTADSASSDAT